jgi:hypothetical protein
MRCDVPLFPGNVLPKAMLFALLVLAGLLLFVSSAAARPIVYKDWNGKWRQIDSAQRPKIAPNAHITKIQKVGGVTFNVVYKDVDQHTGIGFDDPALGATRRATVNAVFAYLAEILDETGSCDVQFDASLNSGTGFLAQMGTFYFIDSHFEPGLSFSHLVTGVDPAPGDCEVQGVVDFGYTWNSGQGAPVSGQSDLYSVILHELTHGLGMTSLAGSDGASEASPANKLFSTFDDLLYTGNGAKMWDAAGNFVVPANALTGQQGGVRFHGTVAAAALGRFPEIYAPGSWQGGSSISHWDDASISPDAVMEHAIPDATLRRTYQPFEISMLFDLGYHLKGTAPNAARHWAAYP